jgi:hypothetical protein
MARFYIELKHDEDPIACARAVQTLLRTGSHFLTNADFGCYDGDHHARIIVDVENKEEARSILPTEYRYHAKIIGLNRFKLDDIDQMISRHEAKNAK